MTWISIKPIYHFSWSSLWDIKVTIFLDSYNIQMDKYQREKKKFLKSKRIILDVVDFVWSHS